MNIRSYSGPADLRLMQNLVQQRWTRKSRWHIGDLAWNRFPKEACRAEWPTILWENDGSIVGWGWASLPRELDFAVHPAYPHIAYAVVDWFLTVASDKMLSAVVLESEEHLIHALEGNGFDIAHGEPFSAYMVRNLADLPEPHLPYGFVARSVRGEQDVERRAAAHRAAWGILPYSEGDRVVTSRVTAERYRDLMSTWPYRPELDWIIEAPDGSFVASCCIWLDDVNRVGEIEPLGTHPDFRRLGLARAVCLSALRALRQFGAIEAIVYPRGDEDYPIPSRLYRSIGFSPYARTLTYVRRKN